MNPLPPSVPLSEHLSPWKDREIWIEIGLDGETLLLTEKGCSAAPLPHADSCMDGFHDEMLHCHYTIETNEKTAGVTLWRTEQDLMAVLEEAEALGVVGAVGLYQELSRAK